MTLYPELMIRPDDYEIFTYNEDGTYSSENQKRIFPKSQHMRHKLRTLEALDFMPGFGNIEDYKKYFIQRGLR